MWAYMGLIRIFTKRRGHPPDFTDPVILSSERSGTNVKAATQHISREMIEVFNYALVSSCREELACAELSRFVVHTMR